MGRGSREAAKVTKWGGAPFGGFRLRGLRHGLGWGIYRDRVSAVAATRRRGPQALWGMHLRSGSGLEQVFGVGAGFAEVAEGEGWGAFGEAAALGVADEGAVIRRKGASPSRKWFNNGECI